MLRFSLEDYFDFNMDKEVSEEVSNLMGDAVHSREELRQIINRILGK